MAALLLLVLAAPPPPLSAAPHASPRYAGRSLEDALLDLRARGLRIVFTSHVVRPEMRVEREPAAGEPRRVLDQLLAPHGLAAREGAGGVLVVVPRPEAPPPPAYAESPPAAPDPAPVLLLHEEIVVTPSRISLLDAQPAGLLAVSRREILSLPHLGDDFFRALTLLPGMAANDITARFHVRGGRRDESLVVIDGQELFAPFHLEDLDSPLSVVAPATLAGAELSTGGFSARHGDRMSGVLDMTTLRPAGAPRGRLGAGVLGFHLGGGGAFGGERGAWLVEARRDTSDLLSAVLRDETPDYWDAFGKLDYRAGPRHALRFNSLLSGDAVDVEETRSDESKRYDIEGESAYHWLTHLASLGADLALESAVASAGLERERLGVEEEEDARFAIRDERESAVVELRQAWQLQATPRHFLQWGWQRRDFESEYEYDGTRRLEDPLARIRHDFGREATRFAGRFDERDTGLYLVDRMRLREPLTLELGVRHDRHSQTAESRTSPRLNLAWLLAERSVVRLAWGRFHQSQRPYELQVEDGETAFHPVERAEHRVLGFETLVGEGAAGGGLELRLELYQRRVANPRPRYENLFEAMNFFPEVEPDRVRIAPERSVAEGAELFLRGELGDRAAWWINYAHATTEDEIAARRAPRLHDQTHAVNADLDLRAGRHWRVNLAWRYHTGWPTTPLALRAEEDEEGEVELVPVLGPLNAARLADYHRLDLRASRRWQLGRVALDLFVDVQNLYDRRNLAGFDVAIDEDEGTVVFEREDWPGLVPSAGVALEF
ncbi:MAG TPA: TonB-dependent receptor [Thermoanaerobaculia bacterium]|nr:TonB-dependent receptor [Thermoanaerobaculia bacterium]